ncbi:MAG: prepilin-type N-terminal cleavage/methylation domain-containing protein [Candidatus Omnitrophota bacterium]
MRRQGFTLIEVLIAFGIFAVVAGFVLVTIVGMFKSFHQGERMLDKRQSERMFLQRLNKEISSVTRISYPEYRFRGTNYSFYFIFSKEDSLAESGYLYDQETLSLQRFYEEPPDYDWGTYAQKDTVLKNLVSCRFSYSNGTVWQDSWEEDRGVFPKTVKINFRFKEEPSEQEFIVNIPISQ